jgi:glycosyltransferase involved in cell wall biosynthesis
MTASNSATTARPRLDVSIIITCYNQAEYLAEAIESVLGQTHRNFEIVVVDDGSQDDPQAIANRYPEVVFLKQANQGACVARNRGIEHSSGPLLVFMDGDDQLLPHAFETGVTTFAEHPECAFAYGWYQMIGADGGKRVNLAPQRKRIEHDHYRVLLERNILVLHSGMFRREAIERLGAFDPIDWEAADLDLYLRMTRSLPAYCHGQTIAVRRVHGAQASQNWLPMLGSSLRVLARQWPFVKQDPALRKAYEVGRRCYTDWFGARLVTETYLLMQQGRWRQVLPRLLNLAQYHRAGLAALLKGLRRSNTMAFTVVARDPPPAPSPGRPAAGSRLEIVELVPSGTVAGRHFHQRPDDERSVLGVRCRNATPRTIILFDGKPLTTVFVDEGFVWCFVPYEQFREAGERLVYLLK